MIIIKLSFKGINMKKNILKNIALTCSEYGKHNNQPDNRSIATIGDSLLSFLYLDYIYEISNTLTTEELTLLKQGIQENNILNDIGEEIFKKRKIKNKNNDLMGTKLYATITEAYTYALFKDKGFYNAKDFVIKDVLSKLKIEEIKNKFLLAVKYNSSVNEEYKKVIDYLVK